MAIPVILEIKKMANFIQGHNTHAVRDMNTTTSIINSAEHVHRSADSVVTGARHFPLWILGADLHRPLPRTTATHPIETNGPR